MNESFEHCHELTTMVDGKTFTVWTNFRLRGLVARNEETGEEKVIKRSGYLTKDLAIRKAIAIAFKLDTFRHQKINH